MSAFDSPAVRIVSVRGNHFVLVNSMALEGDGCFLCKPAEQQLMHIECNVFVCCLYWTINCCVGNNCNMVAARLKCTKGIKKCGPNMRLSKYSRPILMQVSI